ncbi:Hpt domain-containing protein [Arthrobacter sp. ISL-30]|uniref:Hpt domain-containing protein n=1 Tax=Arthrobacter sp. ISL-30 TaxID=2819109 RepID=UPI001BEB9A21|nr:Hpt domain-containing protein [Arthrobacter sp. ISL-30]MBT2513146.1 Hpt domain-containing protein [Arthrobacter sp. ISL-30]
MTDSARPVLDSRVLLRLAEQAGQETAQSFLETYLGLLPFRRKRTAYLLSTGDMDAVMDAVQSLRTTSSMIGARHLEHYCRYLEFQLRSGSFPDPETVLSALATHAEMLIAEVPRTH